MVIIMDFVVARLLLTLFALGLKTENEKIYDCARKKNRWIISHQFIYYTSTTLKATNSFGAICSSFYEAYARVYSSRFISVKCIRILDMKKKT